MDSIPTKSLNKKSVTGIKREARTDNSTFAIGGVSCSVESFVVSESLYLRINICGEKPAQRKSAKRYVQCNQRQYKRH